MRQRIGIAHQGRIARDLAIIACASLVTVSNAHADEDWRKLQDVQPPVYGPGYFASRDGGAVTRDTFDKLNMQMYAWMPLNLFPGSPTSANDIWGYTSPSGREYAIIGLSNGFGFVEVTDPGAPVLVGHVTGPNSLWHCVKVIGHYAYGGSEGGAGIQVMDMSQIDNGVVTLVQNKTQLGHTTTHTLASNEDSGFLYLAGANIANGGLVAVSLANPADPIIVGSWSTRYVHEAQVVTYTSGPYAGREIAFCYTGSAGIDVIDVTNKASMTRIGGINYSGVRYSHQGWLTDDKQYLYMNDELDEGASVSVCTTRIFNVSNPASPVLVGTFSNGLSVIDHNLYIKGDKLYESNYRSGLRVFDISNRTSPVEIAYFDTYPGSDSFQFNGNWTNYPYFASGIIVLSDIERGLFVLAEGNDPLPKLEIALQGAPTTLSPGQNTPITAVITEVGTEELDPTTVVLRYQVNGGSQLEIPMTLQPDDTWRAVIPAQSCFDAVTYRVAARAIDNSPYTTAAVDALVATGVDIVFEDDMEINRGWTVGAAGDNATAGIWNRMDPQGTAAQPEDDTTPAPGVNCWVTDGRAGSSIGTYDVDGGTTTLVSPVINLAGATAAKISYWRWYSNDKGAAPNTDTFVIQISNNNGSTWTTVETVGPTGPQASGGWNFHEFNVGDFVAPTSTVRMRFRASDLDPGSIVEAAVDDFTVRTIVCVPPPACPADYNGDNEVDVLDFLDFFDDFGACSGQPGPCGGVADADFNGDTLVDILDFLDFLDAFGTGC
ncbi:MAG: choice-of-anchor B family protein [Phycisphaeraceae bacterium]|nr:MAG: choice-of-anchor B family protein [Phycisphaeraceae bacterium]